MPLLFSIPLDRERRDSTIVIVHQGAAFTAPERLKTVRGFSADGRGGFIGAAQTSLSKWGYINESGKWIVAPEFDDARAYSEDGLARFKQGGRWGYVNLAGEVVIAPQFDEAVGFAQGLAAVRVGEGQWRFIDRTGKFAFEKTFAAVGSFSPAGLAAVVEAGQKMLCGYIDRSGNWVIKPRFKSSLAFGAEGVAPASQDGRKFGLIDRSGNWVLSPTYPSIREFNEEGLAYFDHENSWDKGHGYLDVKGQIVVKGERHLSPHMTSGVACAGTGSEGYLTKAGQPLPAPRLSWTGPFNDFGYAIVRTADFVWSETLQRHQDSRAQWGILRNDGSFVPAELPTLEPLTDAEGAILAPRLGTPLSPFLTTDGQVVFLDRNGAISFRVRYANHRAALVDTNGEVLWQSEVREDCRPPSPFFHPSIEAFFDRVESVAAVVPAAEGLVLETEEKLRQFAIGETVKANPPVLQEDDDEADDDEADDDESDDEGGESDRQMASLLTARRLVRAYVSEEHNGEYQFLGSILGKTVTAGMDTFRETLAARFGASDPDPEIASSRHARLVFAGAWPINLKLPIAEDAKPLPEANQLWVGLYSHSDSGDGDEWKEVWLVCAPSIDAFDAAKRQRAKSVVTGARTETTEPVDGGQPAPLPQTYDEWLAAVCQAKYAISGVPPGLINDAMVDAAIAADPGALEYTPAQWQTPSRLEALVRKDASIAARIPPKCMTPVALTLARSLYAQDQDWRWTDERNSQLPTEWTKNCLYYVWGGLLSEKHCLLAVAGGESLDEIPHWLRTRKVEHAALDADIYNISYVAADQVTPKLAARAVRHSYGKLIEHIPAALITPQLCLISARTNGLSLEQIPEAMRSVEVCVEALRENSSVFAFVPPALRLTVSSRLIELDLEEAKEEGEPRVASRWHGYRAWLKLKTGDYVGAVEDAKLALERLRYPQTAHYVLASAYRALNRRSEAALEASTILSLENPYQAEYDPQEDTQWLQALAVGQFDDAGDETLLEQLKTRPRALADVPRDRITSAMVETALAADPDTIEFVPKRLMTPERYVIAMRQRTKVIEHVPAAMIREETYIELVRDNGHALDRVPLEKRTVKICAFALRDAPRAIEYVPDSIREAAQAAAKALPSEDEE